MSRPGPCMIGMAVRDESLIDLSPGVNIDVSLLAPDARRREFQERHVVNYPVINYQSSIDDRATVVEHRFDEIDESGREFWNSTLKKGAGLTTQPLSILSDESVTRL